MAVSPDFGLRNVVDAVATTASTSITAIPWTATGKWTTVVVANNDSSNNLYIKVTRNGAAAPTITTTNWQFIVPAGEYRELQVSESIDVWTYASSSTAFNAVALGA